MLSLSSVLRDASLRELEEEELLEVTRNKPIRDYGSVIVVLFLA